MNALFPLLLALFPLDQDPVPRAEAWAPPPPATRSLALEAGDRDATLARLLEAYAPVGGVSLTYDDGVAGALERTPAGLLSDVELSAPDVHPFVQAVLHLHGYALQPVGPEHLSVLRVVVLARTRVPEPVEVAPEELATWSVHPAVFVQTALDTGRLDARMMPTTLRPLIATAAPYGPLRAPEPHTLVVTGPQGEVARLSAVVERLRGDAPATTTAPALAGLEQRAPLAIEAEATLLDVLRGVSSAVDGTLLARPSDLAAWRSEPCGAAPREVADAAELRALLDELGAAHGLVLSASSAGDGSPLLAVCSEDGAPRATLYPLAVELDALERGELPGPLLVGTSIPVRHQRPAALPALLRSSVRNTGLTSVIAIGARSDRVFVQGRVDDVLRLREHVRELDRAAGDEPR